MEIGLRYLGKRRRFEREVRSHLRKRGVPAGTVTEAVERLRELGVLSDLETSRAWIADRLRFSPRARRALRVELLRKGVREADVDLALEEAFPEGGELAVAVAAVRAPARKLRGLPEAVVRRRLWASLARRGFDPETVREAIVHVLGEERESS